MMKPTLLFIASALAEIIGRFCPMSGRARVGTAWCRLAWYGAHK